MALWNDPNTVWNGGLLWSSTPSPVTPYHPKSKKSMKLKVYFPIRIGDQVVWLRNFKNKLPGYSAALGLDPLIVAAIVLDAENAIYALDSFRGALAPWVRSKYETIDTILYGDSTGGSIVWGGFTPPPTVPATVDYGCVNRIFAYISDEIRDAPGYTAAIGEDLGIEGSPVPPPSPTVSPDLGARETSGGKLEVLWKKGEFEGIKLEFDLGTAGIKTDIDLRPNYTLNWLPPIGTSVIIRYRAIYLRSGEEYGNWSDWVSYTLTGA
jgi:hypothetical protein